MYKNIFSLNQYFEWLLKKYQALQQEVKNISAYQILEVIQPNGIYQIKFHITGTGKTVQLSPKEIVLDDTLLEGFSKKDVRVITYYACEERKKPTKKIIAHTFSEQDGKVIFSIKQRDSEEVTRQTAEEISLDPLTLKKLSQEDAHRVGYLYGIEEADEEKAFLEK